MFSYLRYFSIISLVLVCVVAYLIGVYFKSRGTEEFEQIIQKQSAYVANAYEKSVWHMVNGYPVPVYKVDEKGKPVFDEARKPIIERWINENYSQSEVVSKLLKMMALKGDQAKNKALERFETLSNGFFASAPVIQAVIHNEQRGVFYSLRPAGAEIEPKDSKGASLFEQAKASPEPVYRIVENVPIYDVSGRAVRGTILQTFYPLYVIAAADIAKGVKGPLIAVLQLQFDVTGIFNMLTYLQYFATGGIILIFFILIGVLFFSMQRAEVIIAKQHELNLELTAAVAAAEAENRDKSQFLANISHELRTPLNAIIGFSEILKNDLTTQLVNQHREYLDDIHGSGKHLLSLINDILDYSKAEAGKLEVDISEIDGIKMVKNSLRLVIPRAEQAQVTLMEDLPTKHFILQTDAKKLKQVLLNLLSNAVKFTPAGGEVRVACWHNPETDKVTFEIKDTGVGIAQKDIARVMTPFGQADSTLARRFEGTGLGLPLSKKFVEIMGGTFTLTSEVNKGTTVTLVFPRMFNKEAASKIAMASSAPTSV